jgi:hypothetical protein
MRNELVRTWMKERTCFGMLLTLLFRLANKTRRRLLLSLQVNGFDIFVSCMFASLH